MYDHLEILIKMRYAELLEEARITRLVAESKAQLLSRAHNPDQNIDEDATNPTYVVSSGQEESFLKSPHTGQLINAAKGEVDETMDEHDLSEVIYFKKSVY